MIALLAACCSLVRAVPLEDPVYSANSCTLLCIDPRDGSAREFLKLDNERLTAPVVIGDVLYVGDGSGRLHALNTSDGRQRWEFKAPAAILCVAATEKMIFVCSGAMLYGLDTTGHRLWSSRSDVPLFDITLVDGAAIINTRDGPVAIDQSTGVTRWQLDVKWTQFFFSPLPDKRMCVWKTDEIFVIATGSGKPLWQKGADHAGSAPGAIPSPAVATGESIYQLRGSSTDAGEWSLHKLDAGSGRRIWVKPLGQHPLYRAQTFLFGKTAYATLGDQIFSIDGVKGDIKWQAPTKPIEAGGPGLLEAHSLLYIPELSGSITALDAATGKIAWENTAPKPARRARILVVGMATDRSSLFITRNDETRE
jgi:outer membrane protein assembly factor BamB